MGYIIDKLFLLFFMSVVLITNEGTSEAVVAILLALISSSLFSCMDKKIHKFIVTHVTWIITIAFPQFTYVSPVLFYDAYENNNVFVCGLYFVSVFIDMGIRPLYVSAIICLAYIVAIWLYRKTYMNEKLTETVKHIRDDSQEKEILLSQRNKHLIEKQDQEIYVATLTERNRIAREIHDNVGHIITRTILQMGALMTIYKEEPLHEQLVTVKENLDIAMNNVRESVHDIHDESIDLVHTLEDIVKPLSDKFEVKSDFDVSIKIDRKYKYAIIGIVKEAVSNIIKYSRNDYVEVVVREHPSMIQLVVHDKMKNERIQEADAKAVRDSLNVSDGIGLKNIEDRVTSLKGHMTIDTDNGFRLFATFPK